MEGTTGLAVSALVNIMLSLLCIAASWWVLLNVRLDLFLRDPRNVQAKALRAVLAIVLGHGLATFLIDYSGWSRMIGLLFG
ncbi:DUF1146 domain-containing protein [Desmospora activa]|uniref:Putative membrane protein YwzB n=1 Tax=Desmospora activa DSM 45169 TaxID=1121389 RepID=A0A2T4Z4C7_9BACL|nr:DUF1146 family protein [Desmospora activa]PTM56737.1 putative membrane protein YwzB [Desmospora activa DSM 45169]